MSPGAPIVAEIVVNAACWQAEPAAEMLVQRAIETAARSVRLAADGAEVAIVLTDDSHLQTLNRDWRGIDKQTNVLSFPAVQSPRTGAPAPLGDIAIAYETSCREATEENKPFAAHLSHLAVHGFLHLVGYDHETEQDAEAMETLERTILADLGIPDPYR